MMAVALAVLVLGAAACGGDDGDASITDQRALNSVIVGSYDVLSPQDSQTVSAIGATLVALGAPLAAWFDGSGDHDTLLAQMTSDVDQIDGLVRGDVAPEVTTTFTPYVSTWRALITALRTGDDPGYRAAVAELERLDQIRVDRVADVYGPEVADQLRNDEGDGTTPG